MTKEEFDLLRPIITYDDWVISKDDSRLKFYVHNIEEDYIKEVDLVVKERSMPDDGIGVVDFPCDYSGETDDLYWLAGFNLIE